MSSFNDLREKAKSLRNEERYNEALPVYKELWDNYRDNCNEWDCWGYAFVLRKLKKFKESLVVSREVYKKYPEFENIKSVYAWCIYYTEIGIKVINDIKTFIKAANGIIKLTKQEDKYSPYTITVFKVLEYFQNKQIYNPQEIIEWTDKLNPDILDTEPFSFKNEEGKDMEIASKKEQWYMLRSKALLKKELFKECIEISEKGLNSFGKFHYGDDIWLKRNIALSKAGLGNIDIAINELKELLKKKKEWFIQHELAKLYKQKNDIENAITFSVDAALNFGDTKLKIKLYKLITNLLIIQNMHDLAKKHVEFICKLQKSNKLKEDPNFTKLMKDYGIDGSDTSDINELERELKKIWNKLKFGNKQEQYGVISSILPNGKTGFITTSNNNSCFFFIKDFKGKKELLNKNQKVSFYLEDSFDKKKNKPSQIAVSIKPF